MERSVIHAQGLRGTSGSSRFRCQLLTRPLSVLHLPFSELVLLRADTLRLCVCGCWCSPLPARLSFHLVSYFGEVSFSSKLCGNLSSAVLSLSLLKGVWKEEKLNTVVNLLIWTRMHLFWGLESGLLSYTQAKSPVDASTGQLPSALATAILIMVFLFF